MTQPSYPTTLFRRPRHRKRIPMPRSALARVVRANLKSANPNARPYDLVLKIARLKLDEEYAHVKGVNWALKKDEVRRVVLWAIDEFNRKARLHEPHTPRRRPAHTCQQARE